MRLSYQPFERPEFSNEAVHASLRVEKKACLDHELDPSKLQTGGVVGIAEITDCVQKHRSKWFVGPYGFILKNRRSLPFVKWTGALGLRNAPTRLLARIGLKKLATL
jgi:hypothetical protein